MSGCVWGEKKCHVHSTALFPPSATLGREVLLIIVIQTATLSHKAAFVSHVAAMTRVNDSKFRKHKAVNCVAACNWIHQHLVTWTLEIKGKTIKGNHG